MLGVDAGQIASVVKSGGEIRCGFGSLSMQRGHDQRGQGYGLGFGVGRIRIVPLWRD